MHEMLGAIGDHDVRGTPVNLTFFLALVAAFLIWVLIWRTRLGYEMRAFGYLRAGGASMPASTRRGSPSSPCCSRARMAGMMAINIVMGYPAPADPRLRRGAGFVGIAVALMGRIHPVGVVLAAILFGILYQGGAELALRDAEHPAAR